MTKRPPARIARSRVAALGNGWWRCLVLDSFGGLLRDLGRMKGKMKAQETAARGAQDYNATHQHDPEPGVKWKTRTLRKPIAIPAGEGTDIFNR